jgi:hypothetical protein
VILTEDGIIPQEEPRGQHASPHLSAISFPESVIGLPIDVTKNLKGEMVLVTEINFTESLRCRSKHGALLFGWKENQP